MSPKFQKAEPPTITVAATIADGYKLAADPEAARSEFQGRWLDLVTSGNAQKVTRSGEWWGCPYWMVKGSPPAWIGPVNESDLSQTIEVVEQGDGARAVRWGELMKLEGTNTDPILSCPVGKGVLGAKAAFVGAVEAIYPGGVWGHLPTPESILKGKGLFILKHEDERVAFIPPYTGSAT